MLFLTHLAAAVIIGRVSQLSTGWLVVGAAFPDVLDKPLAMAGVFELYHSVGHSAFLVLLFIPIALYSRAGVALAVGWASHLLFDALHVVINGRPGHVLAFLWPVAESAAPLGIPPGAFFWYYLGSPSFYFEIALWIVLVGLIAVDRISKRSPPRQEG